MSNKTISIRADNELIHALNNLKLKRGDKYVLPETSNIIKRAILYIDEFVNLNIFEEYTNFYFGKNVNKRFLDLFEEDFKHSKNKKITKFDKSITNLECITPAGVIHVEK